MTGIILSGGLNSRIGLNKAFLEISGKRIIERTVLLFTNLFQEVIVVTKEPLIYEYLDVRIVTDVEKVTGSLMGVYSGLLSSTNEYNFIAACDMPLLDEDVIRHIISKSRGYDAAVPFCQGRLQSLHAVYSKRCIHALEELINSGNLKIARLFEKIKTCRVEEEELKKIDPDLKSFININTKEDLRYVQEMLER
jgi:molybdopterin-guanine dinucleotide biosynthesis protein A